MSPTTARRTSSKEKNEWRTKKINAQIRKCEKKITIQTNRINLPAPVEMKKCPSPKKQISFSLESCIAFLLHFEEQASASLQI